MSSVSAGKSPRGKANRLGYKVVGLFAGIGGIELGLHGLDCEPLLLCENHAPAVKVLSEKFPGATLFEDVRNLSALPTGTDLLAAGFPCQDLSQAGQTKGIDGKNSGLVQNVFRLLAGTRSAPTWLLIENVPFMLQLDRGKAMHYLTGQLESLGFRWAYRTIDSLSFGVPQRRRRVILLASKTEDPRSVLFAQDSEPPAATPHDVSAYGFYWTEGNRGLGWAVDAVPTLKGGSTIGIPSPPAIWLRDENRIVTPDIRDAERLQGFRPNWTLAATRDGGREGVRWKLVGNAVCVPVSRWVGKQLLKPREFSQDKRVPISNTWPSAAWGEKGKAYKVEFSEFPTRKRVSLTQFLKYPTKPLSLRASEGFLSRAKASTLNFHPEFLQAVEVHVEYMRKEKS